MNEIESIIRGKLVITNEPGVQLAAKEIEKFIFKKKLEKELSVYQNIVDTALVYSDLSNQTLIVNYARGMVVELEKQIKEFK